MEATLNLNPLVQTQSAKARAYQTLKEAIILLELPPGTPLTERNIAEQLGISKTPVREALLMLQRDGLVEQTDYRGTTVASLTLRDVLDVLEVRQALEGYAVRLAAQDFNRTQFAELEEIIRKGSKALEDNDQAAAMQAVSGFHDYIASHLKNERLKSVIDNLADHTARFRTLSAQIPEAIGRSTEEHWAILQAMEARDAQAAEMIVRQHLRHLATQFAESVRAGRFAILSPDLPAEM